MTRTPCAVQKISPSKLALSRVGLVVTSRRVWAMVHAVRVSHVSSMNIPLLTKLYYQSL